MLLREAFDELLSNIYKSVEDCLSVDIENIVISAKDKIIEIAIGKQSMGRDFVSFLKKRLDIKTSE